MVSKVICLSNEHSTTRRLFLFQSKSAKVIGSSFPVCGGLRVSGYHKKSSEIKPLITILVATYNSIKSIDALLLSVLALSHDNVELIVIDGGSVDGTVEYLERNNAVIDYWLSEPDGGIYQALNKGLALASEGAWILVLGSDDKVLDLTGAIESIKKSGCETLIGNVLQENHISGQLREYKCWLPKEMNEFVFLKFPLHHQGFIFKNRGGFYFKEGLGVHADYEYMISQLRNSKCIYLQEPFAVYSTGGESDKFSIDNVRSLSAVAKAVGFNRLLVVFYSPATSFRILAKLIIGYGGVIKLRKLSSCLRWGRYDR